MEVGGEEEERNYHRPENHYLLGNAYYEWCELTQWAIKFLQSKGTMVERISLKGVMLDLCF